MNHEVHEESVCRRDHSCASCHLGRPSQYGFLVYLLIWSFLVAAALMSACGVAAQAVAYSITAIFGLAMVVIGSTVEVEGGGANLIIILLFFLMVVWLTIRSVFGL